jgi:hypothetical protein
MVGSPSRQRAPSAVNLIHIDVVETSVILDFSTLVPQTGGYESLLLRVVHNKSDIFQKLFNRDTLPRICELQQATR